VGLGDGKDRKTSFPRLTDNLFGGWQEKTKTQSSVEAETRDGKWMSGSAPPAGTSAGRRKHAVRELFCSRQDRPLRRVKKERPTPFSAIC
jgi:hypothetical protein